MRRYLILLAVAISVLIAGTAALSAAPRLSSAQENAQEQEKLAREAKVTKEQAQAVALTRAPGTVESAELEREHGRLVYSFDIRNAKGTIDEVQVSAITGKIVRVEHENKKQEAAEKRKEQREKKRKH